MTKKMFRVASYTEEIQPVDVVKQTPHFVTFLSTDWRGKQSEQKQAGDKFFDTWEAARDSLVADYETQIKWSKDKTHRLESRLGQIRKMQP